MADNQSTIIKAKNKFTINREKIHVRYHIERDHLNENLNFSLLSSNRYDSR